MILRPKLNAAAVIVIAAFAAIEATKTAFEAQKLIGFKPMIVSVSHYHQLDNIKPLDTTEGQAALSSAGSEIKNSDYSGVLRFDLLNPSPNELTLDYVEISNVVLSDVKAYGISGKTIPFSDTLSLTQDRPNSVIYLNPPAGVRVLPNDGLHLDLYVAKNSASNNARIDPHISSASRIFVRDSKGEEGEPLLSTLIDLVDWRYNDIQSQYRWNTIYWTVLLVSAVTVAGVLSQLKTGKEEH